jgi:hypothetical protein
MSVADANLDVSTSARRAFLGFILILFLAALTWANFHYLQTPAYTVRDFMNLWAGGRAILLGLDPFDPAVWLRLRVVLGSTWMPNPTSPYPLWTLMIVTPLAALPLGLAAAIWLTLSQTLLAISLWLLLVVIGRRRPTLFELAFVILGAFLFRGTLVTLLNGQVAIVLLFVITLFLVLTRAGRPFSAGFVLAFILLKPSPFFLFAPIIALWLILHRRWRVVAGGAVSAALLLLASWLVIPGWLLEWDSVTEMSRGGLWSFQMATWWGVAAALSLDWAALLGTVMVLLTAVMAGWAVFTHSEWGAPEVISLALVASLLATPYAWAYEHTLLLIPLALVFAGLRHRRWALLLWLALVYVLPWLWYQQSDALNRGTVEVLTPILVGIVLVGTLAAGKLTAIRAPAEPSPA